MSEKPDEVFTFSIEGKEYEINKKSDLERKKSAKKVIHGPSIGIGSAVTAICIIGIFFALNVTSMDEKQLIETEIIETQTIPEPFEVTLETFLSNGSPVLGNIDSPITLVEFGDYQCHYCNVYFQNTEQRLLEKYVVTGKVNIIFKDFIIMGPDSFNAAHGAHCASEQNRYWEYHDVLYNNWAGENTGWAGEQNLLKFANELELKSHEFQECMNSNRYAQTIEQSKADGLVLGISGTPSFFIIDNAVNKVVHIHGAQPYEVFEDVFNSVLEE